MKRKLHSSSSDEETVISTILNTATNFFNGAANMVQSFIQTPQYPLEEVPSNDQNNQNQVPISMEIVPQNKVSTNPLPQISWVQLNSDTKNYIFNFLYLFKNLSLREVSKDFHETWETMAKFQLRTPLLQNVNEGFTNFEMNIAEKQRLEINYLIKNKEEILKNNKNDPVIKKAFSKLSLLKDRNNLVANNLKENSLDIINEIIIKNKIAEEMALGSTTTLDCDSCHLTRFPSKLFKDPALTHFWADLRCLTIENNQLTTLPEEFGQLKSLVRFCVSNNQLIILPDAFKLLTELEWFQASNNQIINLPDIFGKLTKLNTLCLNGNNLNSLPNSIEQLSSLLVLRIDNNEFSVLPNLEKLTNLQGLSVTENYLSEAPNKLAKEITLYDSNLEEISKSQCLDLQKKPLDNKEYMTQVRSV